MAAKRGGGKALQRGSGAQAKGPPGRLVPRGIVRDRFIHRDWIFHIRVNLGTMSAKTPPRLATGGRSSSFHEFSADSPKGNQQLGKYKGQITLIVNLASK